MADQSEPTQANDNADPYESIETALDWLYLNRRELLQFDPETMTFDQRRRRKEALQKFADAEKALLAEI